MQIDFSASFDRIRHQEFSVSSVLGDLMFKVLSVLTQFLSKRSQNFTVDGWRSKLVNVVSGAPQGSVLGPLLFVLFTSYFSLLDNKLISCADDFTLIAVVLSPGVKVTVAESLNRNLGKVSEWCGLSI